MLDRVHLAADARRREQRQRPGAGVDDGEPVALAARDTQEAPADPQSPVRPRERVNAALDVGAEARVDRPIRAQVDDRRAPLPGHPSEVPADVEPARAVGLDRAHAGPALARFVERASGDRREAAPDAPVARVQEGDGRSACRS